MKHEQAIGRRRRRCRTPPESPQQAVKTGVEATADNTQRDPILSPLLMQELRKRPEVEGRSAHYKVKAWQLEFC